MIVADLLVKCHYDMRIILIVNDTSAEIINKVDTHNLPGVFKYIKNPARMLQ